MPGSFKSSSIMHRDARTRPTRNADNKWLKWVAAQFKAANSPYIDKETFKKTLQIKNVFFADRFFDMFDEDKSGTISVSEMMDGLFLLNEGTKEEKIKFFFDVYDLDNNGEIDKDELRRLLKTGMEESSVQLSETKLDHLTDTLFISADQDHSGSISFDEFMETLRRHPNLMENFSIGAAAWMKSSQVMKTNNKDVRSHVTTAAAHIRNNTQRIGVLVFIFIINVVLIVTAIVGYAKTDEFNFYFAVARGCGNALNFDCSFIVLLLLRKALSFLRSTWLFHCLPFDDTIRLHKLLGYLSFVLAILHTLGHIGNAVVLQSYKNFTAVELLFTNPSLLPVGLPIGRLKGSAFITGWILVVVLLVLIVSSLSYVRRSGHFEIFFWTHRICYILFWFLLIIHTPRFWYWFLGPAVCFILEKVSEMKIVKTLQFGKTYIKEVNLLPSGVTHLVLTRPRHFKYKAGDYIFIQIPEMAAHEWHPFTISSAPEQIDTISVHIRSAGNWTKRVYQLFNAMTSQPRGSLNVMTSQPIKQGVVNGGFELSPLDGDEEVNVVMIEEFTVDDLGIDGSEKGDSDDSDFEYEDGFCPVLTIRRVSYQTPEDLPSADWKLAHGALIIEEESEEDRESDGRPDVEGEGRENGKLELQGNEEVDKEDVDKEKEEEEDGKLGQDVKDADKKKDEEGEEKPEEDVGDADNKKDEEEEGKLEQNVEGIEEGLAKEDEEKEEKEVEGEGNNEEWLEEAGEEADKTPTYTNGHRSSLDFATLNIGKDSTSVTVEIESPTPSSLKRPSIASYNAYGRRKSKPLNKPNVKFDLNTKGRIRVHIQGPYGTPSTSIFHSEHAVMIGAGIGVTPYASILQSIMYRHRSILNECPNCNHSWIDLENQKRALRVTKVDFIWMNRNYMAFEWFVDMLLHLENEQSQYCLDRFLDIHLFITGMKRFDLKNIGLQMALDLVHEKENRDLLTGLRTKLQAGRPDWEKLFTKIKSENKGKVSVFFCGAPALGSVIRNHCDTFGFKFHKESF